MVGCTLAAARRAVGAASMLVGPPESWKFCILGCHVQSIVHCITDRVLLC